MAKPRAPKLLQQQARIEMPGSGELTIVVVADTHSAPHPDTAKHIAARKPDHILHAGDIGSLEVLDGLAKLAPLTAIRGNIDVHASDLPDLVTLEVPLTAKTSFALLLMHIAVYGPKLRADAGRIARAQGASMVVCGHSHVPFIGRDQGLTIFNPGSIGPRRFHLPIVFGVMEIKAGKVGMHHVSCETGERWQP